jgi:hypothetical protein
LFEGERSVLYNDENFEKAFAEVEKFEANFGGTDIFSPLKAVFDLPKKDEH